MNANIKIMILYAGFGDGHYQASKAIQDRFHQQGFYNTKLFNLFAEAHPLMDSLSRFIYLKSCSYTPELYGLSYYLTKKMPQDAKLFRWLNSLGISKLMDILEREKPDAIIQTFPFFTLPELKKHYDIEIPAYTVITDFVLHHRWIHPLTEKYFVATDDLRRELIQRGVQAERIVASGIPLRPSFYRRIDKSAVCKQYGLDERKKTVLIMAGAYGILQGIETMVGRLSMKDDLQVLLVCGKNARLKERVDQRFAHDARVQTFGFVEKVEELMAVSACIVTKAGGITLAESMNMELPALIYNPLPGQEKENAVYLEKKGMAFTSGSVNELILQIENLMSHDALLARVRENIHKGRKTDASSQIVKTVLEDLQTRHMSPV